MTSTRAQARRVAVGRSRRLALIRVLVVLTALAGVNYVVWRWLFSVSWDAWWIAVPLVLAETYSLVDTLLFGMTMWRLKERDDPPPPPPDATVDVFITTYDEPVDLVLRTARAALAIRHPHRTWILDDGARAAVRAEAEAAGIGYITRSADWDDRERHAKAGNLNNALQATAGDFVLVLDADQVPLPEILDRTLGWFTDPQVALVQTRQVFSNVPHADPLGSQAPLFYGPIQQGKDGWDAAFFCGSNAVLRREALMQLGVVGYVREVDRSVREALRAADRVLARASRAPEARQPGVAAALDDVRDAVRGAQVQLADREPLADVTYAFQRRVDAAARGMVSLDVERLRADLAEVTGPGVEGLGAAPSGEPLLDDAALDRLAQRDWSPLGALESVRTLVRAVDIDRSDEAQPVMPMATISVTEDMATSMRLHGLGWRSVYHDETLALGLAPEDLAAMLTQRLRWAQGTMQVFLRENPLLQRGMRLGQRLMYFSTMWSYLSGFAAVVYLAAPVVFLCFGVLPVQAFSADFFARLVPFLLVNQVLYLVVGRGIRTWRGEQYSLALFPVWIRACVTAFSDVVLGRRLRFAVTPKTGPGSAAQWHRIRPQLVSIAVLVAAAGIGLVRLFVVDAAPFGTAVNVAWVAYDLAVMSVVVRAARYRGFVPEERSV